MLAEQTCCDSIHFYAGIESWRRNQGGEQVMQYCSWNRREEWESSRIQKMEMEEMGRDEMRGGVGVYMGKLWDWDGAKD